MLLIHFTVSNVIVTGTEGLGLLAVNLQRSSLIENSVFSYNHPLSCYKLPLNNRTGVNLTENNRVGGGAYFIFLNFANSRESENTAATLDIRNSTFLGNSYCGLAAMLALDYNVPQREPRLAYSLGAGGGLSVVLAQTAKYIVEVEVHSSQFRNNTSYFGGGALVAMFEGVSDNSISFHSCTFLKNGLAGDIITNPEYATSGSALSVMKDLIFPTGLQYQLVTYGQNASNALLFHCSLIGNRASYAGAVNIYSLYGSLVHDTVTFDNCTFIENEAIIGTAVYAGEKKQNGFQPGIKLVFRDVKVTKNRILSESVGNIVTSLKSDSSGAIDLQSIHVTFEGYNSLISNNYATALRSVSSVIYIQDHTVLCNNTGSFGGGMHLIATSYLVLRNNSHLRLENNTGAVEGGAFYVNLMAYGPDFYYQDCFLYFEEVEALLLWAKFMLKYYCLEFLSGVDRQQGPTW